MFVITVAMLVILAAASLVVTYVAYPQRGREVPRASWLGPAMTKAATRVGLDDPEQASERDRSSRS